MPTLNLSTSSLSPVRARTDREPGGQVRQAAAQASFLGHGRQGKPRPFPIEPLMVFIFSPIALPILVSFCITDSPGSPPCPAFFPANIGLWGCPTIVTNVETVSVSPTILRRCLRPRAKHFLWGVIGLQVF